MDSWTDAFVKLGILLFSKAKRGHESRSRLYLIRNGEVGLPLNKGLTLEYSSVRLGYLPRPRQSPSEIQFDSRAVGISCVCKAPR